MENFKSKIKKRAIFKFISGIIVLPLAVATLIIYFNADGITSGTPLNDFIGGFFNGVRGAVVLGFSLFQLITGTNDIRAVKNEEKLKTMQIFENDERMLAISEISSKTGYNISLFVIILACLVFGLFGQSIISITLLAVWVVIVLIRLFTFVYYNKQM